MSEDHRASIAVLTQTHNDDDPEEVEDEDLEQFLEFFDNPSMSDVLIQIEAREGHRMKEMSRTRDVKRKRSKYPVRPRSAILSFN